jgi:N-acetylglutamate synthase-like GNAT family acetyltransferase
MWEFDDFIISTDRRLLNFEIIYNFISTESYWGIGRSRETMQKSMEHSAYCFGVYHRGKDGMRQIGFARVISDLATFAYLADVFILKNYRGKGLGKRLIQAIVNHPELKTLKRIALKTQTPDFYTNFEFKLLDQTSASKFMERSCVAPPAATR